MTNIPASIPHTHFGFAKCKLVFDETKSVSDARIIQLNESFTEIAQREEGDLLTKSFSELQVKTDGFDWGQLLDHFIRFVNEKTVDFTVVDQSQNNYQLQLIPQDHDEIICLVTGTIDYSDQLKHLTNRFNTFLTNFPGGIMIESSDFKIQQLNKKFCNMVGLEIDEHELEGTNTSELIDHIKALFKHPDL